MASTIWLQVQGKDLKPKLTLVNQLTTGGCNSQTLLPLFQELKDNITQLDKKQCNGLITAMLNLDWLHQEYSVIEKYKAFVLDFIVVHTNHLKIVLKALVKLFVKGKTDSSRKEGDLQHVHDLLLDISRLVPMMPNGLVAIISECFPYYQHAVNIQENYISNLLLVTSYLTSKRRDILDLIINHIIQLDVHIPKHKLSESELSKENEQDANLMRGSLNTLDTLMNCLFNYIHDFCHVEDQLNWDETKKLYMDIYYVFNNRILTTQACTHVPFLLFYICSMKTLLCENTLDTLWKKVENPNCSLVLRQMAVNYISSLLTHSSFIQIDLVVSCLDVLSKWIHRYIDDQDNSVNVFDSNLHTIFYSVCQALFFVFIFRHEQLLNMTNGFSYLQGLKFERMVTCQLNPLRWCHLNIVRRFASITRLYQLAYCDTIINRNLRFFLPTENPLNVTVDCNFPFHLYFLENSKSFLSPFYHEHDAITGETKILDAEDDDFLNDVDMSGDGNLLPELLSLSPVIKLME